MSQHPPHRPRRSARVIAAMVAVTMIVAPGGAAAVSSTPSSATPSASLGDIDATPGMGDDPVPVAAEPAASTAPDATAPVATEPLDCRRITDFEADDTGQWFIVNDGVMGGRSEGGGFIADSLLRFEGTVVTAGGGFTSARLDLEGDELVGTGRIAMRVRPDGRTFGVTLTDAAQVSGRWVSHRADLTIGPVDSDGWAMATVDYDQLVPSVFGILVDAPPFDPGAARELGIIIADGLDGDFVLDVDWIDACP